MTERDIGNIAWSELTPRERKQLMDLGTEQRNVAAVAALELNAPLAWGGTGGSPKPPVAKPHGGSPREKTEEGDAV